MMWILTALITGLAGSLHCLGMCGPLVLGLHGRGSAGLRSRMAYHLARALAYAGLGALVGALGAGLALAGWQRGLSIGAGLLVLWMGLKSGWLEHIQARLTTGAARRLLPGLQLARNTAGLPGQLLAGFMNGLLPCGMVYVALAASASFGDPLRGAAFMALFGAGTWPAMIGLSFGGGWLDRQLRGRLQPIMQGWMLVLGLLLILRGFDLGIPYLSPNLPETVVLEAEALPPCH